MKQEAETADHKADTKPHANGDHTRDAIILAAIREIAEHGVAGASLRAINVAAGCRNASAAHYHFGNKPAIIEAALLHVFDEVRRMQEPLLAALEERARFGRPVGVREVLEAAYLPFLSLLSSPSFGPAAAKFASRVLVESDAHIQEILNRTVATTMQRTLALLAGALPKVPEQILKLRIFITVTNVIHGAGDIDAVQNSPLGDLSGETPLDTLHQLFDYISAAVSAPPTVLTQADATRMAATLFPQP